MLAKISSDGKTASLGHPNTDFYFAGRSHNAPRATFAMRYLNTAPGLLWQVYNRRSGSKWYESVTLEEVALPAMDELVFEVTQEADGGFVAEALGESIVTEADTSDELRANVREAVAAFYFDRPAPARLRLHLVRDEVLA